MFPPPRLEHEPGPRRTLIKWWKAAEKLAKLPDAARRNYHSLRRKFATELKSTPLTDLAYLGGGKNVQTAVLASQRPDEATMREALEDRMHLHAAGQR